MKTNLHCDSTNVESQRRMTVELHHTQPGCHHPVTMSGLPVGGYGKKLSGLLSSYSSENQDSALPKYPNTDTCARRKHMVSVSWITALYFHAGTVAVALTLPFWGTAAVPVGIFTAGWLFAETGLGLFVSESSQLGLWVKWLPAPSYYCSTSQNPIRGTRSRLRPNWDGKEKNQRGTWKRSVWGFRETTLLLLASCPQLTELTVEIYTGLFWAWIHQHVSVAVP